MATNRRNVFDQYECSEFHYSSEMSYSEDILVAIGPMDKICRFCNAYRYKNEAPEMCCANGKIVLPELLPSPEPVQSLMTGTNVNSQPFLCKIRKYNSCFQMTSFGATKVVRDNFMLMCFMIIVHMMHFSIQLFLYLGKIDIILSYGKLIQ